ncbi:hypothetical protein IC757_02150 [Wenzhouxiangella sp. AB-CW3]|uniref:hypothetical protein n=1 Tax=Wenzhouxiangella sp. AB-CW3 TaxID=2771012 RepID=UPI00168B6331|nr:hypothetical protein [Wenzhouxiangella sp. AB-CW3]QOC22986.1 hypothetical protein IC757_02150 [Wenzhouxiangella sp. AB-CW3]
MKITLSPIRHLLPVLSLLMLSVAAHSAPDIERIAMLHWHPDTAAEARRLTVAADAWLALSDNEQALQDWDSNIDARALSLGRQARQVPGHWAPLGDGVFAWLVQSRDHNLSGSTGEFPDPEPGRPTAHRFDEPVSGRIGRLEQVAALNAPVTWRRLARRVNEVESDGQVPAVDAFWDELASRLDDAPEESISRARELAGQSIALRDIADAAARHRHISRMLLTRTRHAWVEGDALKTAWLSFEALARLVAAEDPGNVAESWRDWFDSLGSEELRGLRQIDADLPVIFALLEDAAEYLVPPEPAASRAMNELADAYARLALFVPDMGFYLDQPVRAEIRATASTCNPDPLLIGPMPRETYERCVRDLLDLLDAGLQTEELAGGRQGPFAPEFLRRELGLVSWQRAAYLDGHLGWMLEAPCQPPEWVNVLEWSLVVEHLLRWVPQRPVFFAASRWQEALADVREAVIERGTMHQEWMDCLSGHGAERRDPVTRLLDRHESALQSLDELLSEADEQFYQELVRPGGDIDLDGTATQSTAYRPETLVVEPCDTAMTCGARVELPVSRALLGLFPNAYLLADQLGMGEMGLCYESVRWVDRASRPARQRDSQVANYDGRLSFELHGTFAADEDELPETVFRYRLTAAERRHYLFAAADPALLDEDCPRELIGESIASSLPDRRPRLIPDRLTYFVSAPTTPESELVANWDRGAEWRDWFVTGERVERLEQVDDDALEVRVQARLTALSARRERELSAPLTAPVRAEESDPLALAMARVADSTAMLRRLLEIHYPRLIRHHQPLRAKLTGDAGLINRDRVRSLRDGGIGMLQVPGIGKQRLADLREEWMTLPAGLREQGQQAPEMDVGLERLDALIRLSRYDAADVEQPEEQ